MLRCKECKNNYKDLLDGLCHRCSPHDIESWFQARDNLIDPDNPITKLANKVAEFTDTTCSVLTKMGASLDKLDEDLKYLSEVCKIQVVDNSKLSARLVVLEKHHGILGN